MLIFSLEIYYNMKKLFAILSCAAVFSFAASAQEAPKVGSLKDEVGLTKDVDSKIKFIKEKHKPEIDRVKDEMTKLEAKSLPDTEKKERKQILSERRKELEAARDKEIRALLTPEQNVKYDEYLKKKREEKAAKKD